MRIKGEIFCFAHLRWCHNGWTSNILIVLDTGVKKYRIPTIERPSIHRTLCQTVRYAPVGKVTLYSVDVYGKRTLSYWGLPICLHRHPPLKVLDFHPL